jgi:hypothetical protein
MAKWEYNIVRIGPRADAMSRVVALDGEGAEGWELVSSVTRANMDDYHFMKRRVGWIKRFSRWIAGLRAR